MSRPEQRPMVKLPTLETRRAELETCAFCPKLCRAACPVGNVEPRETVIPWGVMTTSYALALGDVEANAENAAPAWACTGCHACTGACDHENPVAATVHEARAAIFDAGHAPEAAARVAREHRDRYAHAPAGGAGTRVLVGCAHDPHTTEHALAVARALAPDATAIEGMCCGLPALLAGDRATHERDVARITSAVTKGSEILVADSGCAQALTRALGEHAVVTPMVVAAARALEHFAGGAAPLAGATYHDACSLGRGLGVYDAPRRVLGHVLGAPPHEFTHARERAVCSGAGGLMPVTMPEVSVAMTRARIAPGELPEEGPIVTTCASSLRAFRRAGKVAYDLVDLLARALPAEPARR